MLTVNSIYGFIPKTIIINRIITKISNSPTVGSSESDEDIELLCTMSHMWSIAIYRLSDDWHIRVCFCCAALFVLQKLINESPSAEGTD